MRIFKSPLSFENGLVFTLALTLGESKILIESRQVPWNLRRLRYPCLSFC